ncbi:unnamed protein product [Timema podura]|uniref:Uncharacterized protein n=1 Tax=Timema podura TaxID=61482 RepID=A0ABN7P2Z2_TIMPD|nr:unnamed protein product [Timema podura]
MSFAVKQGRYPLSFYGKDTSSVKYNEQGPTRKNNPTNILNIGPGCETVEAHLSAMGRWFDKVALVTGASGVIGSAVTVKLAQRGMKRSRWKYLLLASLQLSSFNGVERNGCIVVGCDIHLEPIQEIQKEWERKHGAGKIVAYSCDLTIDDDVLEMFRHIKEQLGGVDVMVCCAEYFPTNSLGGYVPSLLAI